MLKDEGILAFSYHHSKEEGWSSVAHAVKSAGFSFSFAQPVKAEMSVATPKRQAKEPIDLDMIIVCKKSDFIMKHKKSIQSAFTNSLQQAREQIHRFWESRRRLSRNDLRIVMLSHFLVSLDQGRVERELQQDFEANAPRFKEEIEKVYLEQTVIFTEAKFTHN